MQNSSQKDFTVVVSQGPQVPHIPSQIHFKCTSQRCKNKDRWGTPTETDIKNLEKQDPLLPTPCTVACTACNSETLLKREPRSSVWTFVRIVNDKSQFKKEKEN